MANLLATAATHGGVISRAISNGKRFIGSLSISSASSSHVILDKLSAAKIVHTLPEEPFLHRSSGPSPS